MSVLFVNFKFTGSLRWFNLIQRAATSTDGAGRYCVLTQAVPISCSLSIVSAGFLADTLTKGTVRIPRLTKWSDVLRPKHSAVNSRHLRQGDSCSLNPRSKVVRCGPSYNVQNCGGFQRACSSIPGVLSTFPYEWCQIPSAYPFVRTWYNNPWDVKPFLRPDPADCQKRFYEHAFCLFFPLLCLFGLHSGNACYHLVQEFLSSSLVSKSIKLTCTN